MFIKKIILDSTYFVKHEFRGAAKTRKLRFAFAQCIFGPCKLRLFWALMKEMMLSFGVIYNSVAQKLRILAIFKPENPFLANLTIQLMLIEFSEFLLLE